MATELPKLQQVSVFRIDPTNKNMHLIKNPSAPDVMLASMVQLYNNNIPEEDHFTPVPLTQHILAQYDTRGFEIIWYVSIRRQKISGASQTLVELSGRQDLGLGTITEHHLIFLYKKSKQKLAAEKTPSNVHRFYSDD